MSTAEIKKAVKVLKIETLKNALKAFDVEETDDREAAQKKYQETVLDVGLETFLEKLDEDQIKATCKVLGSDKETTDDLRGAVGKVGITGLIDKVDDELLKKYCKTLGLEDVSRRETMIKQIADEVMLTGMESFLNKLSPAVLRKHCGEMGLNKTGRKKELTERLMVHIFGLEPLDEEEEKKPAKKTEKAEKKAPAAKSTGTPNKSDNSVNKEEGKDHLLYFAKKDETTVNTFKRLVVKRLTVEALKSAIKAKLNNNTANIDIFEWDDDEKIYIELDEEEQVAGLKEKSRIYYEIAA